MQATTAMAISKKYTKETAIDFGAVKGANCQISNIDYDADGNSIVTFMWKNQDDEVRTTDVKVNKGRTIKEVTIDVNSHLIVLLDDDTVLDAGVIDADTTLQEDLTATVDIGTVTSGKKYPKGTSLETIIRDMLIKEEAPVVALTISPTTTLYDIVSDTVSEIVMSAKVTKKTYAPKTIKFYVDDVAVNERDISDGGTFNYTYKFEPATNTNHTFKVVVSDGKLSGQSSKAIKFIASSYYGTVGSDIGTPTEAQIKALGKTLKDSKGYTYDNIVMDFGKVVYAYPSSLGALTSIKDTVNNLNYTDSFSRTTVKVDNIDYYVYTQTDPSSARGIKLVFA